MASRQTAGPLQVCRLGEATPAALAPSGHAGTRLVQCVIAYRKWARWVDGGIVSKRLGSPYRSGRSPLWVKVKNPSAPAVKREAEEDWGR
jgi:hypothetical protein